MEDINTVKLTSINFKEDGKGGLSSVCCNYSNGQKSPAFEKANYNHQFPETIEFTDITKIRKVFTSLDSATWRYLTSIRFLDRNEDEVGVYNPRNYTYPECEQVIKENEELFGVYGVKGKKKYFTTFGFIVKVRND